MTILIIGDVSDDEIGNFIFILNLCDGLLFHRLHLLT
mgnify:CR=1 FL=1